MKKLLKTYLERPELAGLVLLVILTVVFQIVSGGVFLGMENLQGILGLLPETGLIAVGVTVLMICGEFDLSVGSVFALMPMTMAVAMTHGIPFFLAVTLGFVVCVVIGLINGYVTLKFKIPSFITTLGMLYIARSLTVVVSGGFPPMLADDIPSWLFTSFVGPGEMFRTSFIWFLLVAIIAGFMLARTNLGNWITAVGGFKEAAAATGIPVNRVKMICFVLCSVLAGLAGMIQVIRLGSPLPSIGEGLELQAVAAAVIGGTALNGGIGTVLGGVLGAVLIRIIDNGLVLSQVDANWFGFAVGALTIFAVVANAWLRERARKIKVEVTT